MKNMFVTQSLDNNLEIRLSKISKEIEKAFIAEVNKIEKMSKTLDKYITALDHPDKALLVLSGTISDVSLCSFTTVIGTFVEIVSASISLVFLISNGIVKMF